MTKKNRFRSQIVSISFFTLGFFCGIGYSAEPTANPNVPHFEGKGKNLRLVLPPKMKTALDTYDPNFKIWKMSQFLPSYLRGYKITSHQAPFAVIGDFNGDGILDVALFGYSAKTSYVVVFLSTGDQFKVIQLEQWSSSDPLTFWTKTGNGDEYGLQTCFYYHPKGKVDLGAHGVFHLETESFDLDIAHKGGDFYYWKNGKFQKVYDGC